MRFKLNFVQRALLTVAVPAIALSLLWPVQWVSSMTRVRGEVVEHFSAPKFLRHDARFQLGAIGAILGWVCLLWIRRNPPATDGSLPHKTQPPPSAPSGARG